MYTHNHTIKLIITFTINGTHYYTILVFVCSYSGVIQITISYYYSILTYKLCYVQVITPLYYTILVCVLVFVCLY